MRLGQLIAMAEVLPGNKEIKPRKAAERIDLLEGALVS
jgi:hypothetical protein